MPNTVRITKIAGVTLLEILLVLTISTSIILMSIRYYGSATQSLQANSALQTIQAITATIDGFASNGSYRGMNQDFLKHLLPNNSLITPWGTTIELRDVQSNAYTIILHKTPTAECTLISTKLSSNNHYRIDTVCKQNGAADFTYTYLANV